MRTWLDNTLPDRKEDMTADQYLTEYSKKMGYEANDCLTSTTDIELEKEWKDYLSNQISKANKEVVQIYQNTLIKKEETELENFLLAKKEVEGLKWERVGNQYALHVKLSK